MKMNNHSQIKKIRLSDIAEYVGVSRTTVASVLLKSAGKNVRVSEATAKKINTAAKKLGYCPNAAAQRLAGKESRLIGVLIDSFAPTTRFRQLAELERVADGKGFRVIIGQSHGELEKISAYVNDFIANGVEGVICISHDYPDIGKSIVKLFQAMDNTVFIGRPLLKAKASNWVSVNHEKNTQLLAEYLLETGRKHPVFCMHDTKYQTSIERRQGFLEALKKHGISNPEDYVVVWEQSNWDWNDEKLCGRLAVKLRDLMKRRMVDAILSSNDIVALHMIRALRLLNKKVPEDIAVTGYDNLEATSLMIPSLTTVDTCEAATAKLAFEILIKLINSSGDIPPQQQMVCGKIISRETTEISADFS